MEAAVAACQAGLTGACWGCKMAGAAARRQVVCGHQGSVCDREIPKVINRDSQHSGTHTILSSFPLSAAKSGAAASAATLILLHQHQVACTSGHSTLGSCTQGLAAKLC